MFTTSIKHIKKSLCTGVSRLKRHSDSISIRIVTDLYTGEMKLYDGSNVLLKSPVPSSSELPDLQVSRPSDRSMGIFSSSSSSRSNSVETSNSTGSLLTPSMYPNSRLFRGSQDEFGFDVYIMNQTDHDHGLAYLYECPTALPWKELIAALATEVNRPWKDVAFSSKVFPDIVNDEVSYAAWLAWSREQDGPCSTDLWLV